MLDEEAMQSPPRANGLLMLPCFLGERALTDDMNAKGVTFGLNLTHTRVDMYRARVEGIALGTCHVTDTFTALDQSPWPLLAAGGGTKIALWLQATSDITGIDQVVCEETIGACYGNAFLAALAHGWVDRGDIARWNPYTEMIATRRNNAQEKAYQLFRRLYEQTKDITAELG